MSRTEPQGPSAARAPGPPDGRRAPADDLSHCTPDPRAIAEARHHGAVDRPRPDDEWIPAPRGSSRQAKPRRRIATITLRGRAGAAPPRSLRVRGDTGHHRQSTLADCCSIEVTTAVNTQLGRRRSRAMSMRKLREAVLRDLRLAASTRRASMTSSTWSGSPRCAVPCSNYGLRSMAGRPSAPSIRIEVARRIRDVVVFFEPRLSAVRVLPTPGKKMRRTSPFLFDSRSRLWGQPAAQHLSLRTHIDVEMATSPSPIVWAGPSADGTRLSSITTA